MSDPQPKKSTHSNIAAAFVTGTEIMLIQAPFVNGLNSWSVVACRQHCADTVALKLIYQGKVNQSHHATIANFGAGMAGHLGKEIPRLGFKSTGLYIFKPWLSTQLPPHYADLAFAATLSASEMLINPFDTWRVNIQAGVKLERSLRKLYAGSLANCARQFGTWWGFGYSNRKLNALIQSHTELDSHGLSAQLLKAYPQSFFFTTMVYPFERVKNKIQYDKTPNLPPHQSIYFHTAATLFKTHGMRGFFHGFLPKVASNSLLALGSNVLLELGQRNLGK